VLLAWGSKAEGQIEAQQAFLHGLVDDSLTVCDSPDDLKLNVAQRAATLLNRVTRAHDQLKKDPKQFSALWRRLPSSCFACSVLVLSRPLPGVHLQFPPGITKQDLLHIVVNAQVMAWMGLCSSWTGKPDPDRSLEDELESYFAPDAMIHDAGDEFLRVTEDRGTWSAEGQFCIAVLRASIRALRGKSNPEVRELADLFVLREVALTAGGDQAPDNLWTMRLSPERARQLIPYEALFDACARMIGQHGMGALQAIDALGARLEHPGLAARLAGSVRAVVDGGRRVKAADVVRAVATTALDRGRPEAAWNAVSGMLDVLKEGRTVESLTAVADGLLKALGDTPETRARADAWLCAQLLRGRFVEAALNRIGNRPRKWEAEVPVYELASLWNERSNCLRAAGRREEAIPVTEAAIRLLAENRHAPSPDLRRNLGILYQETGRQEEALAIFRELLDGADGELRLQLLRSVGTTYLSLGRFADAQPYFDGAAALASGPLDHYRPQLRAAAAGLKWTAGDREGALAELRDMPLDEVHDPNVLIPLASAWINASQHPDLLEPEDGERLSTLIDKLAGAQQAALDARDMQVFVPVNRLLAILSDIGPDPVEGGELFWELLDKSARDFEGAPDPLALLGLARHHWNGDRERAKALLLELPAAVAQRFGPEQDPTLKLDSLRILRRLFDQLGRLAIEAGPMEDARFLAEAQRDLFGRIAAAHAGARAEATTGLRLDDAEIRRITGPAAVLEWLRTEDGLAGIATFVGADGALSMASLDGPGVDLDELAERIGQRLSVWHPGRKGDPFELPEWKQFAQWLQRTLEGRLPEGGQVVVVEHEDAWGLQWHVAAAPRWRASYAASWGSLLEAGAPAGIPDGPLGVAMVTKFHEAPQVLGALEESVRRTRRLAKAAGRACRARAQSACDHKALAALLEGCAAVKILCHGYVDPADKQVALMLARDGCLPLADSVSAATPEGRRHRFGWKECAALRRAPKLVYSAACSSGQAHPGGLGERLGLFAGLRRAGTRTFVAPRWNLRPADVLPILDDALARSLIDGVPPGQALHEACAEAAQTQPPWIAWALALEGDWR
jgi:tetratricopeptide (TPR) repeat protein